MAGFIANRDGGKTTEEGLERHLLKFFTDGVLGLTHLAASQRGAGANMSVDIAVGDALIDSTLGYPYHGWIAATDNASVTASDPSNPRKDILVYYVDLAVVSSATNNNSGAFKFKTVAGTPAGSPTDPTDPTIQASVGASNPWKKQARIDVAAGVTSITNANITDLRTFSSLALVGGVGGAQLSTSAIRLGDASITAAFTSTTFGSFVDVTGLSVAVTVPAGGRKVKITAFARNFYSSAAAGVLCRCQIAEGATALAQSLYTMPTSAASGMMFCQAIITPTAGSHTYKVQAQQDSAGTLTVDAGATYPAFILVEAI